MPVSGRVKLTASGRPRPVVSRWSAEIAAARRRTASWSAESRISKSMWATSKAPTTWR
ncbi:hypothetical protein [Planomonospora algeriensis]